MSIVNIRAALEITLDGMSKIIPSVVIATSTAGIPTVFQTATPHGLSDGLVVSISGHLGSTPALDGIYFVVVTGANTFTLQNRVTKTPIVSTASGTGGVIYANLTAWEGVAFAPVAGVPFQRVNLLPAMPENPTFGGPHTREHGLLQLTLYYPVQYGTVEVMSRAELIRSTFPRGASFSNGGVVVHIPGTAEIFPALVQNENFVVPVRIPYWADVFDY